MSDGATCLVPTYEGTPIGAELPLSLELAVTETEPGHKGDRVSSAQAGDGRDRGRGAGAAVHRAGPENQGRHSLRHLHVAREQHDSLLKGRRAARRLALDVLYEAEIRGRSPVEAFLGASITAGSSPPQRTRSTRWRRCSKTTRMRRATGSAIVTENEQMSSTTRPRRRCAGAPGRHRRAHRQARGALGLQRMPVVDRTVLRMATCELLWGRTSRWRWRSTRPSSW